MSLIVFVDFTQPNFSVLTFTLTTIASHSNDFTLADIQSFTTIDSAVLHAFAQVNLVRTSGTGTTAIPLLFYILNSAIC